MTLRKPYLLLDLFAGELGWTKGFLARGCWEANAVDLKQPKEKIDFCEVWIWDVEKITSEYVRRFDFAVASSPCEEFACFGMKHWQPNPKYPALGIRLFIQSYAGNS